MKSLIQAFQRSLFLKFITGYLILGILCFLTVGLFTARFSYNQTLRSSVNSLYTEATTIADEYSSIYSDADIPDEFREQLDGAARYSNQRIWFIDTDGLISYDSYNSSNLSDSNQSSSNHSLEGTVIDDFNPADSKNYYRIGTFYGTFTQDMLSVSAPIVANFRTYGYVIIHVSHHSIVMAGDRSLIPFYITVGIVYALSLSILIMLYIYVVRPVNKITQGTKEYAQGNLSYHIEVNSDDELGYLADTLNVMTQELRASEENQRRFIANVSHDFRSPLTSIKGYLEAMIDGVIPLEMQEKYMRIVINETDRLTNLTQSMLSLNSLERNNIHLEYSDFDICMLIKDVCATFEGKCTSRDITLDLVFSSVSVYVHADFGKIQQVIYNLLDNAVKFSNDDSEIEIRVTERRDRVAVSIKDHGIGIPRDNLSQIWTRFFKTDESRGKDKRGTGLGLSIVREIIQAHGETIDVISTEGVGTEFVFRLPAVNLEESEWTLL